MAGRREKLRRVGIIPEYRGFTPDGLASGDAIDMTVDELEVLRLCDLEGLNQEAVAQQMGIARATVAAICSRAHRKVASALVNGRALIIKGGNIVYSPITTRTAAWPAKEVDTMRVATTYDNGNIFMHFGRSEQFKIYDIQDGKVLTSGSWAPAAPATVPLRACSPTAAWTRSSAAVSAVAPSTRLPKPASRYTQVPRAAATLASRPLSPARSHRTASPRAAVTAMTTNMARPAAVTAITSTRATRAAAATNGTAPRAQGTTLNAAQQSKPTTKATR